MSLPLVQVGLRLDPETLRRLDRWIARQRQPISRSKAIRLLLSDRLSPE